MAITKNAPGRAATGWAVNATTADASGTEELVAAPGTGLSLYLEQVSITCAVADITITIGTGEAAGAVETVVIGPVATPTQTTAAGYIPATQYTWKFTQPLKLTAEKSLTVDASAAGAVQVYAEGYTQ